MSAAREEGAPHVSGKGGFAQLLTYCGITDAPMSCEGCRKYDVFIGIPHKTTVPASTLNLYQGSVKTPMTIRMVYARLAAKFPNTEWLVSESHKLACAASEQSHVAPCCSSHVLRVSNPMLLHPATLALLMRT